MDSPKQRLLKQSEDKLKGLRTMLRSPQLQECAEIALLEFMANQHPTNETLATAANHFRLEGARSFIHLLYTLADVPKGVPVKAQVGQLEEIAPLK